MAVFRVSKFKKLIKSLTMTTFSILIVWLISLFIFVATKYAFRTQPGHIYCYDGYSTNDHDSIDYYIATSIVGYILPLSLIIVIYVLIRLKLRHLEDRIRQSRKQNQTADHNKSNDHHHHHLSSHSEHHIYRQHDHHDKINETIKMVVFRRADNRSQVNSTKKNKRKEKHLAQQFILMNMLEFASCVFFVLLSLCNVFESLNENQYYIRQLFRVANLICQSLIPIVSLVYNPVVKKLTICFPVR